MKNENIEFLNWLRNKDYCRMNLSKIIHIDNTAQKILENLFNQFKDEQMKDTIVESVIEQFKQRSNVGINKYGVTLDRDDLTMLEWLKHLQEELMDATLYIEKLKSKLNFEL